MNRSTMITTLCLAAVALLTVTRGVHGEECAPHAAIQIAHEREVSARAWYIACAMRAEEEGLPAAACLFRVVARAESVHAAKEAAVIEREFEGTPSSRREDAIVLGTAENLRTSIECEKFELGIVYPMIERCLRQMNKYEGLWRCSRARCAEATHACAFALALRALGGGTRREDCTATYAVTGQDPPRLPDQWYLCLGCGTVSAEPMICDNCGNLSLSVVAAACER